MSDTPTVHNPIVIDDASCIRCVICDFVCPGDIIHKTPDKELLPEVRYPDQCWYCGLCEQVCPTDAISIVFPDNMLNSTVQVIELLGEEARPSAE